MLQELYNAAQCLVRSQVYPSGSLEFVSQSGTPQFCCSPKPTSWDGEEVIGASVSEQGPYPSVHVNFCPEQVEGGKSIRRLKKAGPFQCADAQQAKQLAEQVRKANNCHGDLQIGGKTVLAVVRPTHAPACLKHARAVMQLWCSVNKRRVSPDCLCR